MPDDKTLETSHAAVSPSADTVEATPSRAKSFVEIGASTVIGRYTVLRTLGAGGMGVVYAARDAELGRDVALKVLREDRGGNAALERRLQREAQAMAKLSHESVVRVFDVGTHNGLVFLAMELVDGVTIAEWVAAEPRTWRQVVDVYRKAGRGLAEAHAAGLIHRDFKPGNVLIDRRGRVKVTDFGLARAIGAPSSDGDEPAAGTPLEERLTRDGALVGTPRYMAPEQLARHDATARSDQFSFAVALYEGVAGVAPFRGQTTGSVLEEIRAGRIVTGKMPRWLRRVLVRALAAEPADRFPSMDALLRALDRGRSRNTRIAVAVAILGVAGISAGAALAVGRRGATAPCERAADRVAAAWTHEQRGRVLEEMPKLRPAFGSQTAKRVVTTLDAYAQRLRDQRVAACRATVDDKTPVASAQCLDEQLRSLASVATALSAASPEIVDRADDVLAGLADCEHGNTSVIAPPEPGKRAAVDKLRDGLADADVLASRGDYAGALAALRPLAERARAVGYAAATAEVLQRLGSVEQQLQDPHAEEDLAEAAKLAAAARDDRTAVRAWTSLLAVAGAQADRPDLFATTATAADTEAARTGDPGDAAALDLVKGQAYVQFGKLPEAEQACRRALDTLTKLHGEHALGVRPALHCLGNVLENKGDYAGSRDVLGRALAIDREVLGADHPATAEDLQTLGELQLRTGQFKDGLASATGALAIRERVFGASSDAVAKTEVTLANLLVDSGHAADAVPHAQRGIEVASHNHGADSTYVAAAYASLGAAYSDLHRYDEARPLYEHAIAIDEKANKLDSVGITLINLADLLISEKKWDDALAAAQRAIPALEGSVGKDSPIVAFGYYDSGRCLNALGRSAEALPLLEHALSLVDPKTSDPNTVAIIEIDLARALWATGGDHARAVSLARDADAKLIAIGDTAGSREARAVVEQFLATHH